MTERLIEVQRQIRENQLSATQYMKDLMIWEKDISEKDTLLSKEVKTNYAKLEPIVLNAGRNGNQSNEKFTHNKQIKENLKRDGTSIQNYYDNWGKFNVDEEVAEIEQSTKEVPIILKPSHHSKSAASPNCKIDIANSRGMFHDPMHSAELQKKDGISFFNIKNYNKAIEYFTNALKTEGLNSQFAASLYNNRGNSYLKQQMYKEAVKDFEEAFKKSSNDLKIIYRLAFGYFKLGLIQNSLRMINLSFKTMERDDKKGTEEYKLFSLLESDCLFEVDQKKGDILEKIGGKRIQEEAYDSEDESAQIVQVEELELDKEGKLIESIPKSQAAEVKTEIKKKDDIVINSKPLVQVNLKVEDITDFVEELTETKVTASSFRLAFSNLKTSTLKDQKLKFLFSISPSSFPEIFKNDLDKEILKEILECLNYSMPAKQDAVLKYLTQISSINRFSLVIKFLKKDSKPISLIS